MPTGCAAGLLSRGDKKAAKKFFRKLLKGLQYVPNMIITDKLRSYSAAKAELLPSVDHCQDKWQNNRAENSHQPTRLRESLSFLFFTVRYTSSAVFSGHKLDTVKKGRDSHAPKDAS